VGSVWYGLREAAHTVGRCGMSGGHRPGVRGDAERNADDDDEGELHEEQLTGEGTSPRPSSLPGRCGRTHRTPLLTRQTLSRAPRTLLAVGTHDHYERNRDSTGVACESVPRTGPVLRRSHLMRCSRCRWQSIPLDEETATRKVTNDGHPDKHDAHHP